MYAKSVLATFSPALEVDRGALPLRRYGAKRPTEPRSRFGRELRIRR